MYRCVFILTIAVGCSNGTPLPPTSPVQKQTQVSQQDDPLLKRLLEQEQKKHTNNLDLEQLLPKTVINDIRPGDGSRKIFNSNQIVELDPIKVQITSICYEYLHKPRPPGKNTNVEQFSHPLIVFRIRVTNTSDTVRLDLPKDYTLFSDLHDTLRNKYPFVYTDEDDYFFQDRPKSIRKDEFARYLRPYEIPLKAAKDLYFTVYAKKLRCDEDFDFFINHGQILEENKNPKK